MSFASLPFFLFLPMVFALHWAGRSRVWQNSVLLAASYFFYGWWDWRFCFLMLAASLVDYYAGAALDRAARPGRKKFILGCALTANLLTLGFFKYFNFFADSLAIALSTAGVDLDTTTLRIVLPVGISFYTFQTMSYTLDIYLGKFRPRRSLLDYLAFVSFFPQLVAGPIERATELLPQFPRARVFLPDEAREGCRFILWGLVKKMLLADNLAGLVERAYASPATASGALLALGTLAFAFQIYCDFSAYSDIAVGAAKLFGIRLTRNFAYPYFAQSISEFWRRWHISLSTWFRDYLFIPLGGSRGSVSATVRNLFITALVSGLWHGAAWHFVAWGGLHGILLALGRWHGRASAARSAKAIPGGEALVPRWPTLLRMARTFLLVSLAWVMFRAHNLEDALVVYGKIAAGLASGGFYRDLWGLAPQQGWVLAGIGAFVAIEWLGRRNWNTLAIARAPLPLRWGIYSVLFWLILGLGTQRTEEFIYFRF